MELMQSKLIFRKVNVTMQDEDTNHQHQSQSSEFPIKLANHSSLEANEANLYYGRHKWYRFSWVPSDNLIKITQHATAQHKLDCWRKKFILRDDNPVL